MHWFYWMLTNFAFGLTKFNGFSSLHSASHEIVNDCWTLCYFNSLHYRNSQRNELWTVNYWTLSLLYTNPSALYTSIPIDCGFIMQFFWERSNGIANTFYPWPPVWAFHMFIVHLVIKPKTQSCEWHSWTNTYDLIFSECLLHVTSKIITSQIFRIRHTHQIIY